MKKIGLFIIVYCLLIIGAFAEELPVFTGDEVVVTAARHAQFKGDSPWSVTVLSSQELEKTGARTLGDALRNVVSMDIKSNGFEGALTSMRMRGSSAEQVLVLVDGIRVSSTLLGVADFSDIPVDDIERVEVVRGSSSALYGADAVGGVVNIIRKEPGQNKTELGTSYGTYNTSSLTFATSGGSNFSYDLSASLDKTDGFRHNSDLNAQSYYGDLKWDLGEKSTFSLSGSIYLADKGVPNVPTSESKPLSASKPKDRQTDRLADLSIKYHKDYDDNSNLEFLLYQSQSDQATHIFDFWGGKFDDTRYLSCMNGVEIKKTLNLSEYHKYTYGADWREELGDSDYAGDHSVNNIGLYFQDEEIFSRDLLLTVGMRGDRHSRTGDFVSLRTGLLYRVFSNLSLRTSIGSSFRSPTLNELYWNDPVWMMYGNEDLSPEKAVVFDIGLINKFATGEEMEIGYFTQTITDMIVWQFDDSTFITRVSNIDNANIQGLELSFKNEPADWLRYDLNFTYQNPVRTFDERNPSYAGKDLPYCPRVKGNIGAEFGVRGGLEMGIMGRLVGERFADAANNVSIPDYFVVDARLGSDGGGFSWRLGVLNLFDAEYFESVGNQPLTYEYLRYPMPGRTAIFGVKYNI